MKKYLALLLTSRIALGLELSEWKNLQPINIPQPGLVKLSLPADTLNAARPSLEDLRLLDPTGQEVPYLIERPLAQFLAPRRPAAFAAQLATAATVLQLTTGIAQPLDGITLDTPASSFIKAVTVEGSTDKQNWQTLATGQPIFRQPTGASQLRINFPAGVWPFLRVTVDDRRAEAIPFTGAHLHPTLTAPVPSEIVPVKIVEQTDDGPTRLTLDLGAAHLTPATLRFETSDPLFTRTVTIAVRQVVENAITERVLTRDTIFRVQVEGFPMAERLDIPLDMPCAGRELLVSIENGDSPPLHIRNISVMRRPVHAVFLAQQPGAYQLSTGNPRCAAPRYDVAALADRLKNAPVAPLPVTALAVNPLYHPAEPLPEIQDLGAPLDTTLWSFRKPIQITRTGVQQLELDLEVLAHTVNLRDLRLERAGQQRPFIIERTSATRKLTPEILPANNPKQPTLSRWELKLPQSNLPVTRLTCTTTMPLFRRQMTLFEESTDERGEKYRRFLGAANWVRTPPVTGTTLELTITQTPLTSTLFLETDNGDNPALALANFQFYYPVTRLLFKAPATPATWLYFGNREVVAPTYDLDLIAPQLLAEEKTPATLGVLEVLKKSALTPANQTTPAGSIIFWGVLGVVVVGLLVVITRLLPKTPNH